MHVLSLLHKRLHRALPQIHLARLSTVIAAVYGLLSSRQLWLTAIGRHLPGKAKEKHGIKRIDRLLANLHLAAERLDIYRWMARLILGTCPRPAILVDWSDVDAAKSCFLLRAAVSLGGRALTLYEEVHSRGQHPDDERAFLARLAQILPDGCTPLLITDAGFHAPWFAAVAARGWFYLGRVRNRNHVRLTHFDVWFPAKTLYERASSRPRDLGELWLTRQHSLLTHAVVYHKKSARRHHKTLNGERCRSAQSLKHAAREREPWLLVSNLPPCRLFAKRLTKLYAQRMTLEEAFRDLKDTRHGFAFRLNRGRNAARLAIMMLIAALATFATWITGLIGIDRGLHLGLQANTERRRPVLSTFYIGSRLLVQRIRFASSEIHDAIQQMRRSVLEAAQLSVI